MVRWAALVLALAVVSVAGCGGEDDSGVNTTACYPSVHSVRCLGNTSRQVCSPETATWTTVEACATNYVCEEIDSGTTCVYVDPNSCETDDDCVDGTCVGGTCLNDHCNDGELSGDERYIDCGGSCPYGCPDGRPCESNEGCESGCCSADGVCAQGEGYAPECVCKNPNADGPACDECLTGWAGATCEVCAPGTYTNETQQSSCKLCDAGTHRNATGGALIGLDLGTKTIGIAVCDAGWRFATALKTLPRGKFGRDRDEMRKLIEGRRVRGIVLGLPRNMDGSEGKPALETRALAERIAAHTTLPVHVQDERLTSDAARRKMAETGPVRGRRDDAIAASIILEEYLGGRS